MRRFTLLLAGCMLMTSPAHSLADLVTNGSFENGAYVDNGFGFMNLVSGSMAITGWTVTAQSIDWVDSYWQAADGSKSLDLSGTHTTGGITVSTALVTEIGKWYSVKFDMSGNPADPRGPKTMEVEVTGASAVTFSFDTATAGNTLTNMGWVEKVLTFQATSTTTGLAFRSTIDSPWGPAIDNVRVDAVPAPGAALLIGLGLMAVGWIKRRIA